MLEQHGFAVLTAANGEEALALIAEHSTGIDLLIADLLMPRLGGADLYKEVRRNRPGTRVIFTSGFSTQEMAERDRLAEIGESASIADLDAAWSALQDEFLALEAGVGGLLRSSSEGASP